ncbi:hypothetical protein KM043_018290 [Ampulex compressa]|nr:hypothetical protein KM043_018290 [Ampulex compressa]
MLSTIQYADHKDASVYTSCCNEILCHREVLFYNYHICMSLLLLLNIDHNGPYDIAYYRNVNHSPIICHMYRHRSTILPNNFSLARSFHSYNPTTQF